MHLKRKTMPKFWPVKRTGTKYVAVSSHEQSSSIPLIVIIRDILKLVKNKKELKKKLAEKKILINGKIVREVNYPLLLFDSLSVLPTKKHYRIILKNKKFSLEEINEKDSLLKIYKVINKKQLSKEKIQLNLIGGKNILSSDKIECGNFIVLDNSKNKIVKIIPLKKDTQVIAISGKHIGKMGKIKNIEKVGENTIAEIESKTGTLKINVNGLSALQ